MYISVHIVTYRYIHRALGNGPAPKITECVFVCMSVSLCIYVYMYVCVCVCVCIYACMCIIYV
jgi:hypothetical protein